MHMWNYKCWTNLNTWTKRKPFLYRCVYTDVGNLILNFILYICTSAQKLFCLFFFFRLNYSGNHVFHQFIGAFAKFVMSVRLSVRVEQLGSNWADFDKTWYLNYFLKIWGEIRISLKSDKNNGKFISRRFHIYGNIWLHSSYSEKYFK